MAYLKTHHTAEFLAAMCSAGAGFYHVSAYVEEAKRWGIAVRLPSVESFADGIHDGGRRGRKTRAACRADAGERPADGNDHGDSAGAGRRRSVFLSLEDFLRRVPVECDEIKSLIKCGALDEMGDEARRMTRPEMLWQWNLLQAGGKGIRSQGAALPQRTDILFAEANARDDIGAMLAEMQTPEYTREQKLRYEREILEVCVSGHPLDFLPRNGEVWSDELPNLRGKRVTLCGWVVTHRYVGTKNYPQHDVRDAGGSARRV